MKKIDFVAIVLTALLTFGLCFCYYQFVLVPRMTDQNEVGLKIQVISDLIEKNAVMDFDEDIAVNNALLGYTYGLNDIYCSYMPPVVYTDYVDSQQGNFTGIGVKVFTQIGDVVDGIQILRVMGNSPSEEAGLQALDTIVKVDGEEVVGRDYDEVLNSILGTEGTDVLLTVRRGEEFLDFTVTRSSFLQREVDYRVINGNVGFVRIHNFNLNTYSEFRKALTSLLELGVKGFVFDVRNNPGGELNTVCSMVDLLVGEDELVVLQYKSSETVINSTADRLTDLPMVVLINGSSASASELFSSSLRDLNGTPLVGVQSFGKGVGQTTFPLTDGSAVKMTTFYYLTKSRTSYNGIGLVPDIEVALDDADTRALYTLDETNDEQLIAALDCLYASIK